MDELLIKWDESGQWDFDLDQKLKDIKDLKERLMEKSELAKRATHYELKMVLMRRGYNELPEGETLGSLINKTGGWPNHSEVKAALEPLGKKRKLKH